MFVEPTIKQIDGKKYIDGVEIEDFLKNNHIPSIIFNGSRVNQLSQYLFKTIKKYYSNFEIHYAIKACYTPNIIEIFNKNNIKFEIMSEFEYLLLKKIGIDNSKIIFNGPGKTKKMLEEVISNEIESINVDSEEELDEIIEIAQKLNKKVKIGIRIQPDVPQDSFLKRGEKLGVDQKSGQAEKIIKKALQNKYIDLCGIQFHSFINQTKGHNILQALNEVIKFIKEMNLKYKFKSNYIDIGGGWGTLDNWKENEFENFIADVAYKIKEIGWDPKLIVEPGRFLVSDCAMAIAEVIRKKVNGEANWLIVNANSNMLIPLATADFKVETVKCLNNNLTEYNIGDCLCSASGTLERNVRLSREISEGDYIIVKNVGAYTINLSEPFAEPIMPIYLTQKDKIQLIHKGVNIEKMLEYFIEED